LKQKDRETSAGSVDQKPEFWIEKLKHEPDATTLNALSMRLGHELVNWLKDFADLGGVTTLVTLLSDKITTKKSVT